MTAAQVLAVLDEIEALGVRAWVDGGWGVDALLAEQTRGHDDLDLVIEDQALPKVIDLLETEGFEVERDLLPTALALRHRDGRGVDLHPVRATPDGGGDQLLPDNAGVFHYDAPETGTIDGQQVPCCSVNTQVATHLGYPPADEDVADMLALATRFGLTLPAPYDDLG